MCSELISDTGNHSTTPAELEEVLDSIFCSSSCMHVNLDPTLHSIYHHISTLRDSRLSYAQHGEGLPIYSPAYLHVPTNLPSTCLPLYLSTYQPSIRLSVRPSVRPSIHPSINSPNHTSTHPFIRLPTNPSTHPSIHQTASEDFVFCMRILP